MLSGYGIVGHLVIKDTQLGADGCYHPIVECSGSEDLFLRLNLENVGSRAIYINGQIFQGS